MIVGAIVSVIMAGPFVIAAIIEMAIGFGIARIIVNNIENIIKFIKGFLLLAVILFVCFFVGHQLLNLW
jgi:flagellar biosynthesis protein FliR